MSYGQMHGFDTLYFGLGTFADKVEHFFPYKATKFSHRKFSLLQCLKSYHLHAILKILIQQTITQNFKLSMTMGT